MRPLLAIALAAAGAALPAAAAPPATAAAAPTPRALAAFALEGLAADPEARIEDAYKWLFQACRGGEHAAPSEPAARAHLAREWETLGLPPPGEPLLLPLRPDGAVVRFNLRPWKAAGGTQEALLGAFMRSAREFRSSPGDFVAAWEALGAALAERPRGRLTRAAFGRLDDAARAAGYPAEHHSAAYRSSRAPAYRVLRREEAEALAALPKAPAP